MFANAKRADEDDHEELDKIKFDYAEPTEKSKFEMVITRQENQNNQGTIKTKGCFHFL
jgi:G3E family GTPase